MKKSTTFPILFVLILLALPLVSSEIIINQEPREIYNIGDVISVPATIKTSSGISGTFNMDLICNGREENFYKNGIDLGPGEESKIQSSLVLSKGVIGEIKGTCVIKAHIEEEFQTTREFRISDLINVDVEFGNITFNPGETIDVEGSATRENGQAANGFVKINILEGNQTIIENLETVNNGFFSASLEIPEKMKAGTFLLKINVYEQDSQNRKTNTGSASKSVEINQIPTSLEIKFESREIEPGTNMEARAILYDQTGEKIDSSSTITIEDSTEKIVAQFESKNNEIFNYSISNTELPKEWKVIAESNRFKKESTFTILEKEEIDMEIINRTLTITNVGNIPYNKTSIIRIGNDTLNLDVYLDVGQSKNYLISAPDGEYTLEVVSGDLTISGNAILTGNAIDVREASQRTGSLMRSPAVIVFMIIILGFVAFVVFKRGYQRTFVGYISSRMKRKSEKKDIRQKTISEAKTNEVPLSKGSIVKSRNPAHFSLSIKGSRQDATIVNIHIKNLKEIQSKKGNAEETLQKLVDYAESNKACTYESYNNLFLILAPIKTKTFKNEKSALDISMKAVEILKKHNKMFRQKIDFGISLTQGKIVAKSEGNSIQFMSLGKLMSNSKKTASVSDEEILLDETANSNFRSYLKTEKHKKGNTEVYSIKETKNPEQHQKFIRNFLEKLNKDEDSKK